MTGMRFLLLTTTDLAGGRNVVLARMLASVAAQGADVSLRLLAQNCHAQALARLKTRLPPFVQADGIASRVSLSSARNRLLRSLHARDLTADTIIGFPDDDCWYPEGFLPRLAAFFADHPAADLFVCGYGSHPIGFDADVNIRRASALRVVRTVMSSSMFLRGTNRAAAEAFDERLGLGAPFNGGEDTDFAIRAFLHGRDAYVTSLPLVGHPDTDLRTLGKYYRGTALALAKHAKRRPALLIEFLRKLLVGVVLLGRGEIGLRDFAPSLREIWQGGGADAGIQQR